jgi:hypothetical protein
VSQSAKPLAQLVYVHTEALQAAPMELVVSHVAPQAPQLNVVVIAVSQPSVCLFPLQSKKPDRHAPLHVVPALQLTVAMLLAEHTFESPHPPQWFGSVSAKHAAPHWRNVESQVKSQVPPGQTAVEFAGGVEHADEQHTLLTQNPLPHSAQPATLQSLAAHAPPLLGCVLQVPSLAQ